MTNLYRINLKTDANARENLIKYCLFKEKQYVAIGWSCVYSGKNIKNFDGFYNEVKVFNEESGRKRINPAINIFKEVKVNDLFWTRDLDGNYWICRVVNESVILEGDENLDIGAKILVKAYNVGMEVPGQIKASFNRFYGGIAERISDKTIIECSKFKYNEKSKENIYCLNLENKQSILENLPSIELEELVIIYLQIKENLYLLNSSRAKNSTTIKIECEFRSRDLNEERTAVVQVKGGNTVIDANKYIEFANNGYDVYFYSAEVNNLNLNSHFKKIDRIELENFYEDYKSVLPDSITVWEDIFK